MIGFDVKTEREMSMRTKKMVFRLNTLYLVVACAFMPVLADAAPFSGAPANSVYRRPAPNVIFLLDDSTSMTKEDVSAIASSLDMLIADTTTLPDGLIRLGWQSLTACPDFDYDPGKCNNGVRLLDSAQRLRFRNWLYNESATSSLGYWKENLDSNGNFLYMGWGATPSHQALWNVGKYLGQSVSSGNRTENPWVKYPGTSHARNREDPLACRRNYLVFLTDGAFNDYRVSAAYHAIGNADGEEPSLTFPDGTLYSITDQQTSVYRDKATSVVNGDYGDYNSWMWNSSIQNQDGTYGQWERIQYETTLADMAFHLWKTDLQPGLDDDVYQTFLKASDETYSYYDSTSGAIHTVTLTPYWNPKNDPATWQHVTLYTVGYNVAATWENTYVMNDNWQGPGSSRTPVFDWFDKKTGTWSGNPYAGLVTGEISWPDPLKTKLAKDFDGVTESHYTKCTDNREGNPRERPNTTTDLANVMNFTICDAMPPRANDLWHAAINGRGRFMPAAGVDDLAIVFSTILDDVITATAAGSFTSAVGTSQSALVESSIFTASYDPSGWSGDLKRYDVTPNTSGTTTGNATAAPRIDEAWLSSGNSAAASLTKAINNDNTAPAGSVDTKPRRFVMMKGAGDIGKPFKASDSGTGGSGGYQQLEVNFSAEQIADLLDPLITDPDVVHVDVINRVNHIRGDQSNEESEVGGGLRTRKLLLGDIVNSNIWYFPLQPHSNYIKNGYQEFRVAYAPPATTTPRKDMIYVGANDGMLHGFDFDTGGEKIAYIPSAFLRKSGTEQRAGIMALTSPSYSHRYYVDGPVFTADVLLKDSSSGTAPDAWRTYLAGALGAGGKGYYILDVTAPKNFSDSTAGNVFVADNTYVGPSDENFSFYGHIFGKPVTEQGNALLTRQIAETNYLVSDKSTWAFFTNNGFDSVSKTPALFVHYLSKNGSERNTVKVLKIHCDDDSEACSASTPGGIGNGLSTPRFIDVNGDKVPDLAYAGDLMGNIWRFDISSTKDSEWGEGRRIFTAVDDDGHRQPITSAPVWMAHPNGGIMLAFATGRLLSDDDEGTTSEQTIYGIYDRTPVIRSKSAKGGVWFGGAAVSTTVRPTGQPAQPATVSSTTAKKGGGVLVEQVLTSLGVATSDGNDPLWSLTSNEVDFTGSSPSSPAKNGWYVDLPETGERVIENLDWYEGKLIDIYSYIPGTIVGATGQPGNVVVETEFCEPAEQPFGRSFRTTLNIIDGNAPKSKIYNYVGSLGLNAARAELGKGVSAKDSASVFNLCPGGTCPLGPVADTSTARIRLAKVTMHPSWLNVR